MGTRPTGTVTFLFTDTQGIDAPDHSTHLHRVGRRRASRPGPQPGLEVAALTYSPFVDNMATDVQLNSRVSRLTLDEKFVAADRLLVSWHRAGDIPRLFNTLATIVTLLDGRGRPADIVFLDEAVRTHRSGHHDRRVRRRQTAAAEIAETQVDPFDARAERSKAQNSSLAQILLRARQAIASASQDRAATSWPLPPSGSDERPEARTAKEPGWQTRPGDR